MTARGKFVLTVIILAIAGFGAWQWWLKMAPGVRNAPAQIGQAVPRTSGTASNDTPAELVETQFEPPQVAPPGIYQPKGDTIEIELSEYAGYAGLIAANGGLEPNTNSYFYTHHKFKVKITLSEEESWSALNSGKMAASATTVDVLAIYGRQFQVVVPVQIGYSRGADGVVVRSDLKRINHLKGKTLVTSQFTEADFFIRYLAQEAGLAVNMLPNLKAPADADKLNLAYAKDAFAAGDVFLQSQKNPRSALAGCVTWAPKTTETVAQSRGQAHILATSRNLLIIADILVVNRGFAQQHPEWMAGLVDGLVAGNLMVRDNPAGHLGTIAKAFKWDREKAQAELEKVHLSNGPENLAFFSGSIAAAGSFGGIYQSAIFAYGSDLIKEPVDGDRFLELKHLKALETQGAFKNQKVAISPIRTAAQDSLEGSPLLSKNIKFLFSENSTGLNTNDPTNLKNLEAIHNLLKVSPGSTVLLRGHVDNSKVEDFRKAGGETYVRSMALRAVELSKNRAADVKRQLIERFQDAPERIDILGRGWEEPLGADSEQNRRVEAQWFTVE
jgi:NitT/TauT family transport system substrate-binding protein